jgi:hypothetical protein
MTDQTTTEVARVLGEHRPQETSYDAGWLEGCWGCDWETPTRFIDADDGGNWEAFFAHQADELAKAGLLRPQHGAQAPQDGANGGDVGSGRGEGVSTPQRGAQAPGEGEA